MKKIISITLCILLGFGSLKSQQQRIEAASFVKNNKVYLRFIPADYNTFNQCKQDGFLIRRIVWETALPPDTTKFKGTKAVLVKRLEKTDVQWDTLQKRNPASGFLYNLLFEPMKNAKMDPNAAYGLAMLSCDFSVELSIASGLFHTEDVVPSGKYAYLIQAKNAVVAKSVKPAIILVNTAVDDRLKNIDSIQINLRKKEVKLEWNEERLQADYAGYFIERSEDGKQFKQLNVRPHIQIKTQYETNKQNIFYNDTLTTYGKTYYYRIRGLGFFGLYGDYSKTVKCKLVKPLEVSPNAENPVLVNDSLLEVRWHMPDKFDINELAGFNIVRAEKVDGAYQKINPTILANNAKVFLDKNPKQTNYYKVIAVSISGDSSFSHPMMGLIPDKTPPAIPIGLNGKVDSTGKVRLSWKPNKDKDLKGYRIFRNNALNEELVEVTKVILTDTIFSDTLSLETLSEDVFYSITAVDQVFNNSPYAKTIRLKRPDKIKPVEAQLLQLTHNDSAIVVKWIPSTSKDVEKYELWRNLKGASPQKIKEWNVSDTTRQYIDSKLEYGNYYQYRIKVIDDDKNVSLSSTSLHYFDSRIRKPIKKIKYKVDLEQRSITLNWEYPEKDLYSFQIYKCKEGEALKIIKTVKANQLTFEDKELYIGNKYVYKIKAIYNSGAESKMSEEIKVTF